MTDRCFICCVWLFVIGVLGADDVRVTSVIGDSVTLYINADDTQAAEELVWFFNDESKFIAKIDKEIGQTSIPGNADERFRDRLKVDDGGSLNISDVRSTDAGVYKLQISSSSGITYRRFHVTVSARTESLQRSHWMITGPVLLIPVILMILLVSFIISKGFRIQKETYSTTSKHERIHISA